MTADWGDTVGAGCESVTRVGQQPGTEQPGTEQPGGEDPRPSDSSTPSHPAGPGAPDRPDGPVAPVTPSHDPTLPVPSADRTAPKLSVKVKRKRGRRILTVRADEAVTLRGAGRVRALQANKALRITVRGKKRLRLVALDAAGNRTTKRVR